MSLRLELHGELTPTIKIISHQSAQTETVYIEPMTKSITLPITQLNRLRQKQSISHIPKVHSNDLEFMNGWTQLAHESFEQGFLGTYPNDWCNNIDTTDPDTENRNRYLWGAYSPAESNRYEGDWAGWPAWGGDEAVLPYNNYPPNMDTWLLCGPFDLTEAEEFMVHFARWLEIYDFDGANPDMNDYLFFGISTSIEDNRIQLAGFNTGGVSSWALKELTACQIAGSGCRAIGKDEVWIAWNFVSDEDDEVAEGAWLDDIQVWKYETPEQNCLDNIGKKGVAMTVIEPVGADWYPIIRPGRSDPHPLQGLIDSNVEWVRFVFTPVEGEIDVAEWRDFYDQTVDTLCYYGINTLGVINHESLVRQDYNDLATAQEYRQEFIEKVAELVEHYKGRVKHWEIWNEPDLNPSTEEPPFMTPDLFAQLLTETYSTIKTVNPDAQMVSGALSTAWSGSFGHFQDWYEDVSNEGFDHLGLHPYYDPSQSSIQAASLNPNVYFYAVEDERFNNIFDPFLEVLSTRNDSTQIWITEIGWNTATKENAGFCWEDKVVNETQQAMYLKDSFDILFNEVTLWEQDTPAVDKVFWYRFRDLGRMEDDVCPPIVAEQNGFFSTAYAVESPRLLKEPNANSRAVHWGFGLYTSDVSAKPSQCAFAHYPDFSSTCYPYPIYAPLVMYTQYLGKGTR